MKLYYNVGCKWTWSFLHHISSLNKEGKQHGAVIDEVYGSLAGVLPTARSKDRIPSLPYVGFLKEYVQEARDRGIEICYTVNSSCVGPLQDFPKQRFYNDLEFVINAGVEKFIVSMDLLGMLIVKEHPDVKLKVSTIARIRTPMEAQAWLDLLPQIYAFTLDHYATKNLEAVQRLSHFLSKKGKYLEVMVNEACNFPCPRRSTCYNLSSHSSTRGPFNYYPFGLCWKAKEDPKYWVRTPIIIPQDVPLYSRFTGVTHFKITGRTSTETTVLTLAEAYMKKWWGGNLLELWPTIAHLAGGRDLNKEIYIDTPSLGSPVSEWHERKPPCIDGVCEGCDLCDELLRKALRRGGKA
jgi:collagenase-like PrtC family protease